jgi:hypothetical protein
MARRSGAMPPWEVHRPIPGSGGKERLNVEPVADPMTIDTALDAAELLHRPRFGGELHRLPPYWLQSRLARQRDDHTTQAQFTARAWLGRPCLSWETVLHPLRRIWFKSWSADRDVENRPYSTN